MTTDWNPVLRGEFEQEYWSPLQRFVADERTVTTVYPPADEVFAALHLTPYAATRVVILGQDPYHGPRQAQSMLHRRSDEFAGRVAGWNSRLGLRITYHHVVSALGLQGHPVAEHFQERL